MTTWKTALVLAGGGARGAYEAGVVSYLRELGTETGQRFPIDIFCGTSVGALHACHLAATAERPHEQPRELSAFWRGLRLETVLDFGLRDLLALGRQLFASPPQEGHPRHQLGLVRPEWLQRALWLSIPWRGIGKNLAARRFDALAVTATHVGSGAPVVFVQQRVKTALWPADGLISVATRIGPKHALASASLPLLFPAVSLRRRLFVDGGLRLSVPLSPALRLGAGRVVVVSVKRGDRRRTFAVGEEPAYATAPFLIGKTLDALFLDHTEADIGRLRQVNALLAAGTSVYGSSFIQALNGGAPFERQPLRHVREIHVKPSRDLGSLAAEHIRSPAFLARNHGVAGRLLRELAERESKYEADLASYLLFDGDFAAQLIALGHTDAKAMREEWLRFWTDEPLDEVEAAQLEADRSAGAP